MEARTHEAAPVNTATRLSPAPASVVASSFRPTLPIVLAQATGAFERERLSVRIDAASSSDDQLRQLIDGRIDVAHTALDNIVAWSAKAPVRVIGVTDLGVAHELVARSPVGSVADLRGCTIGVDSPRSGFGILLERILAETGLERDSYAIEAVGGLNTRAEALASGRVDACLLAGATLTAALRAGHARLLAIREHFPSYPAIALVALSPMTNERRSALRRYVTALCSCLQTDGFELRAVAAALGADQASAEAWVMRERARITGLVTDAGDAARAITEALTMTERIAPGDSIDPFTDLLMDRAA